MHGLRKLAVGFVGLVLVVSGCARSDKAPTAQLAGPLPRDAAGHLLRPCESALGRAMAPGLITARNYTLANLAHRIEETRNTLAMQGVSRVQTIRYAVRCKPSSVVLTAGRLYSCSTSARICAGG